MSKAKQPLILVTAGPTRERIDEVRDWGNIFTGSTGLAIAQALVAIGGVELITSNLQHASVPLKGVKVDTFTTHGELAALLAQRLQQHKYDVVFMTAAVSDYRPAGTFEVTERKRGADGKETWVVRNVQAAKVKSSYDAIAVLGERTQKLVDQFRGTWNFRGLLVKFKLEVGVSRVELVRIGQASRKHSGADYLVANTLAMARGEGEPAGAILLSDAGEEWVSRADLPDRMAGLVRQHLTAKR